MRTSRRRQTSCCESWGLVARGRWLERRGSDAIGQGYFYDRALRRPALSSEYNVRSGDTADKPNHAARELDFGTEEMKLNGEFEDVRI